MTLIFLIEIGPLFGGRSIRRGKDFIKSKIWGGKNLVNPHIALAIIINRNYNKNRKYHHFNFGIVSVKADYL